MKGAFFHHFFTAGPGRGREKTTMVRLEDREFASDICLKKLKRLGTYLHGKQVGLKGNVN